MIYKDHKIYTVGYAGLKSWKTLRKLIVKYKAIVVDVRLKPYANHYMKQFSYDNLFPSLNSIEKMTYVHAESLGNVNYKGGPIKLNREYLGVALLKKFLETSSVILLCAEIDPMKCHRTYIARLVATETECPIVHLVRRKKSASKET